MSSSAWKLMPTFWVGAAIALWGYNISLTASILNLYRLENDASPLLTMMVIEALVPIFFLKVLSKIFRRFSPRTLYGMAAMFGTNGAFVQALDVDSLSGQFFGITLIACAMAIQKPLMMQVATFVTNDQTLRVAVNNLLNIVTYAGTLLGYISSGLIIKYFGYQYCFLLNSLTFLALGVCALITPFPNRAACDAKTQTRSFRQSFGAIKAIPQIGLLFVLTFALWLTGGSINVLEVPFLKESMNATDMMVSIFFFASASGGILYSLTNHRSLIPARANCLPGVTGAAGLLIILYVASANVAIALPALVLFGYLTSFCTVVSTTSLQNLTPCEQLGDATIAFNTLVQTTTLTSAALGVYLAQYSNEAAICILFAGATVLLSIYSGVKFRRVVQ